MGVFDKFLNAVKLNDDYDDEYFDDEFVDDFEEEEQKPRKNFFERFKKDSQAEEEELYDSEPVKKTQKSVSATKEDYTKTQKASRVTSSKITPMRNTRQSSGNMEVRVVKPDSMEGTREIADTLMNNCTVILNLEGMDVELAQRIIDFTSGSCYSLHGKLQKVSTYIFIITPYNVDISGNAESILGEAMPAFRSTY